MLEIVAFLEICYTVFTLEMTQQLKAVYTGSIEPEYLLIKNQYVHNAALYQ